MSNETKKKDLPHPVNFMIAGLSGMGATAIVHPLDVLKFRMQLSGERGSTADHRNSFQAILNIAKKEKLSGFYKGISANLSRQLVFTSIRIGSYNSVKNEMKKRDYNDVMHNVLASTSTGAFAALIATPIDVAVVRMTADGRLPVDQRRNYKHVFDALWTIKKDEGIAGLWRGTTVTLYRAMVSNVSQLLSYDESKKFLSSKYEMKDGLQLHTYSSIISGFVYSVFSSPMDVLKTRIQQQKIVDGKSEYSGVLDASSKLLKAEGVTAFWKGWPFYYLRVAPATVMLFIFMEQLSKGYRTCFMNDPAEKSLN